MSLRLKLLQGGAWLTIGFVITTVIQMIVNIALVRILPPPVLGDYYLIINIVNFLVILGTLGMSQTILKLIPAWISNFRYDLAKQYFYKSIRLCMLSSLIVSIAFFIVFAEISSSFFYNSFSAGWILLIIALFIVMVLQGILNAMLRSFHNLKSMVILSDIFPKLLVLLGLTILWAYSYNSLLPYLLSLLIFASVVSVIMMYLKIKTHLNMNSESSRNNIEQGIVTLALPLWITSLMLYLLTSGDIWIIGYFLTTSDVAVYGSVLKLIILLNLSFNLIITVVTPVISELYHKQELKKLESLLRITATLSSIPALIIGCIFFIYGEFLLGFIFGEFYVSGSIVLNIISIGIVVNILTGPCGTVLMYTNNQKLMMYITVISGTITIILSLMLVNIYGIAGVAIASCLGMILQNALMFYSVRRKLGVWTHFSIFELKKIGLIRGLSSDHV